MTATVIDLYAAKLTGMDLAKKYDASTLLAAYEKHADILALREGFLAAVVTEILGY